MNQKRDDFEFEIEGEEREVTPVQKPNNVAPQQEAKGKPEVDIEVEDDTPEEDRGREPLPENIVKELEDDELEDYSDRARTRLKQMKKAWHDERRYKEAADRERAEALALAKRLVEENQKLRGTVTERESALAESMKDVAKRALVSAKNQVKEAYEAGDPEQIAEAQEKLAAATLRASEAEKFVPTPLQTQETSVNSEPQVPQVRLDSKTLAWQERNTWWGRDPEMTAAALGLHQKLETQYGKQYVGTDEYWAVVDKTMHRRFPEYFGGQEESSTNGGGKPVVRTEKPAATVVAPASRSTSSKKIVLKQSQLSIAKKLGLTPEQYAREFAKTMEN